jgi:hypothetical protein
MFGGTKESMLSPELFLEDENIEMATVRKILSARGQWLHL